MRLMEILHMIGKNVGKKTEAKGFSKESYTLYDTCDKCPLSVYIDVVCNDNNKALIVSGNPREDALTATRMNLIMEFSELSGNEYTDRYHSVIRQIYSYKSVINGLNMAMNLVALGRFDVSIEYLNKNGVPCKAPNTDKESEMLLKKVQGVIKGKLVKYMEVCKKYESINKESSSVAPTPQYYTENLIMLSKHIGYKLDKSITLAEYAGYIKDYKQHIEILNRNGNKK